jgi:hypothetical protein
VTILPLEAAARVGKKATLPREINGRDAEEAKGLGEFCHELNCTAPMVGQVRRAPDCYPGALLKAKALMGNRAPEKYNPCRYLADSEP